MPADNLLSGQLKAISSRDFSELWKNRDKNDIYFADARPAAAAKATAARYPDEWHAIPLEEVEECLQTLPRDKQIALICNTGLRSYEVALYLHEKGLTNVVNALGGMQAQIKRGETY